MHGEEATGDMYTSIDKVVDKIERQLRRYKSRILTTHRVSKESPPESYLQYRVDVIRGEDVDESAESPQIIKSRQFSVKPMSLDEAVMQMDLMNQEFLVYRDSRSERVNVLYRRSDGNYGLIEPEV
jgi:putative sigma-54 modulation protein